MTGTWRDTLFVWQGKLIFAGSEATWVGSWVGCEDCPDAGTAPTPNAPAFRASDMEFAVAGKVQGKDNNKWHMTGGSGWDLGEGEEKQRHKDHRHIIYFKKPSGYDAKQKGMTTVVAVGDNDFGSFVSAGYLLPSSAQMILGRRSLDEGDVRAKWTVEELHEKVTASDRGFFQGLDLRIVPWRTIDLHANKKIPSKGGKRKRGGNNEDNAKLVPALNLPPAEEFSSELVISTSDEILTSQVRWLEQCNGCGNALDETDSRCIRLQLKNASFTVVGCTNYCNIECLVQRGMPPWASAGRKWAEGVRRINNRIVQDEWETQSLILVTDHTSVIMSSVEDDKAICKLLRDAGWRTSRMFEEDDEGNYHFQPFNPN
jgi:hypothetical protein